MKTLIISALLFSLSCNASIAQTISTFAGGGEGSGPALEVPLNNATTFTVHPNGSIYIPEVDNGKIRVLNGNNLSTFLNSGQTQLAITDPQGNFYFTYGHTVQKYSPATGIQTRIAGTGTQGYDGDGGLAVNALFYWPSGLAMDPSGNLYISDTHNGKIRKVTPDGYISTIASVYTPHGITFYNGSLYVIESFYSTIKMINSTGAVTTIAGGGASFADNVPATSTSLGFRFTDSYMTGGPVFDAAGNLYFADRGNGRVRKIDTSGIITTVAGGSGNSGGDGGLATNAGMRPTSVGFDNNGDLLVCDFYYSKSIRRIDKTTQIITTIAGNGTPTFFGQNVPANIAKMKHPHDVAFDSNGNAFISDRDHHVIRKVDTNGIISTFAGIPSQPGFSGDDGPATSAKLFSPSGIAVDANNNVYIADRGNHRIRKVTPTGTITTIAGTGVAGAYGENISARYAKLDEPIDLAIDGSGGILVADRGNHAIRRIDTNGIITTFSGVLGSSGSDAGLLYLPEGVAVDAAGNTYIADTRNNRVKKKLTNGLVNTIVSYAPHPRGLSVHPLRNEFYVLTSNGDALEKYSLAGVLIGRVTGNTNPGFSGDGGPAINATIANADGIGFHSSGAVFIADTDNNRIRKIKDTQTINFPALPTKYCDNAPFTINASATSGLPLAFTSSNPAVATVSGNTITLLSSGTTTITASQSGNSFVEPASAVSQVLTVGTAANSISFGSLPAKTYGDAPFTISATASSGQPVTFFSSDPSIASVSGTTVTIYRAGTVTITARDNGNSCYVAAPDVSQNLTINKAILNVFANNSSKVYGNSNPSFTYYFTGFMNADNAGMIDVSPVVTSPASDCSVTGGYAIQPSGGSDDNYQFNYIAGTLTINKRNVNAFADNKTKEYGTANPQFTITYSGTVCNDISIDSQPSASTSAGTYSPPGTYTIALYGGADNNYNIITNDGVLTIVKASQTISFNLPSSRCGTGSFTLQGSSSSGLPVSYTSSNSAIISISGSTANVIGYGTVQITAWQNGDANYNAAEPVTRSITISSSEGSIAARNLNICSTGYVDLTAGTGSGYVWNTGQTSRTIRAYDPGTFSVSYYNQYGCPVSASATVYRSGTKCIYARSKTIADVEPDKILFVGNNTYENPDVSELTVYPSPATDKLTVSMPSERTEDTPVFLFDLFGRTLLEATMAEGEWRVDLRVNEIQDGFYIIRVGREGLVNTKKVLIKH